MRWPFGDAGNLELHLPYQGPFQSMPTVFLVDDQTLFRVGLKQVLKELKDVEVAGEASDAHNGW